MSSKTSLEKELKKMKRMLPAAYEDWFHEETLDDQEMIIWLYEAVMLIMGQHPYPEKEDWSLQ